tara:strand:- start:381 stop:482 length:102 start_codon:yes stop_codon:yes gene_type:complete
MEKPQKSKFGQISKNENQNEKMKNKEKMFLIRI